MLQRLHALPSPRLGAVVGGSGAAHWRPLVRWQQRRCCAQPGPAGADTSPVDSLDAQAKRAELERLLRSERPTELPVELPAATPLPASTGGATPALAAPETALGPTNVLNALLDKLGGRTVGLICMNIAVVLYASNWTIVKESGVTFDPYFFSFARFFIAALGLSPFLPAALRDSRVVKAGLELGFWTGAGYLLQSEGLLTTDASRASFLSTFTVIFVPILAGFSGHGVRPLTWAAAVAALVGVGLLEGDGSPPVVGDLWSFLSAIAFGVQVFRTEHWARRLGPKRTLPLTAAMLTVTAICSLGATVLAHPAAALDLAQHPWQVPQLLEAGEGTLPWQAALWTGLVTTDVCLLFEVVALRLISSTEAAIIFALEPVLGAAFAYVLLGERWGSLGWVGAGIIVVSSVAMQLYGSEEGDPVLESGSESESE